MATAHVNVLKQMHNPQKISNVKKDVVQLTENVYNSFPCPTAVVNSSDPSDSSTSAKGKYFFFEKNQQSFMQQYMIVHHFSFVA